MHLRTPCHQSLRTPCVLLALVLDAVMKLLLVEIMRILSMLIAMQICVGPQLLVVDIFGMMP